jgi:FkbM family methyltransferase
LFPPCLAKIGYDLRLEIDPWEWPQISILRDDVIEPKTLHLYEKMLDHRDSYVDVGAHVGFHALVARRLVGEEGKIVAIDPQPHNCGKIMANCRANNFSNILTIVAVAGEQTGTVMLNDQSVRDRSRLTMALEPVNDRPRQFQVPMIRLDQLLDDLAMRGIKLMKIDVEGFETKVLNGLGRRIEDVQNMVIEVLPDSVRSEEVRLMLEFLQMQGFRLHTVEGVPWRVGNELPENNLWAARGSSQER